MCPAAAKVQCFERTIQWNVSVKITIDIGEFAETVSLNEIHWIRQIGAVGHVFSKSATLRKVQLFQRSPK
jgi:hypothetical protein